MALGSFPGRRLAALVALLLMAAATAVLAADPDPGAATATSLKEWLKLSDEQVLQLKPVIVERVVRMDAALDTLDAGNPPDLNRFLAERKMIKDGFQKKAKEILTPEQQQKMLDLRDKIEKAFVEAAADENLADWRILLGLTDEQVAKLEPAVIKSTQGALDLLQELGDKEKVEPADIEKGQRSLDQIYVDLDKDVAKILTPEQLAKYQALTGAPAR
jgi:hypothetical protein